MRRRLALALAAATVTLGAGGLFSAATALSAGPAPKVKMDVNHSAALPSACAGLGEWGVLAKTPSACING